MSKVGVILERNCLIEGEYDDRSEYGAESRIL